jgi:polar amino acid transport system substrate-binding protein
LISSQIVRGALMVSVLAALVASLAPTVGESAVPDKPGFTLDQAQKGKTDYIVNCVMCHGANLEGISGPALKGKDAAVPLKSARDIYPYITTMMPVGNAGGLKPAVYIELMAFILQANGHRPGSVKLTSAALKASSGKIGSGN